MKREKSEMNELASECIEGDKSTKKCEIRSRTYQSRMKWVIIKVFLHTNVYSLETELEQTWRIGLENKVANRNDDNDNVIGSLLAQNLYLIFWQRHWNDYFENNSIALSLSLFRSLSVKLDLHSYMLHKTIWIYELDIEHLFALYAMT